MSKKTPVKKSKRRLKRSVRRSLAAVLMITAIGVAAIPVPENFATEDQPGTGDIPAEAVVDYAYPTSIPKLTLNNTDGIDLEPPADTAAWQRTYSIEPSTSGRYTMQWQFAFFGAQVNDNSEGIICGYNDTNNVDVLNISGEPVYEYFIVNQEGGDDRYGVPSFSGFYEQHKNDTFTITGRPNLEDREDCQEFAYYFPSEYAQYVTAWEEYDAEKEEYDQAGDLTLPAPVQPTLASVLGADKVPCKAENFINTNDNERWRRYYCEKYNDGMGISTNLPNLTGYQLELVIDSSQRNDDSTINVEVYIPRRINADEKDTHDDNYSFRIRHTTSLIGIGNRAFADVQRVNSVILPENVRFIGDSAFENSYIHSITIDSVENIGNYAFKGCPYLDSVKFERGVYMIGTEAFYGVANLKEISFPGPFRYVGPGAFAECRSLSKIDFSKVAQAVTIDDYAFYNDVALNEVDFLVAGSEKESVDGIKEGTTITVNTIGKAAFAVSNGVSGTLTDFIFPSTINQAKEIELSSERDPGVNNNYNPIRNSAGSIPTVNAAYYGLGDYVLAGRTNLLHVVMPADYGSTRSTPDLYVPNHLFYNCIALEFVKFPDEGNSCGFVRYRKDLFSTVSNPKFYVRGPATTQPSNNIPAYPRESTWDAESAVSTTIPYVYYKNGVRYAEVSDGDYLECIDENGVLISCTLKPNHQPPADGISLIIPAEVGGVTVTGIAPGCFSDDNLNQAVHTLTFIDGSRIASIGDSVFADWKQLKKVYIGDSVRTIGNSAFQGCSKLIDVTFNTPESAAEEFAIGTNAFLTNGLELTFHGMINNNYKPYTWAMDVNNVIDEGSGIRVCYKSMVPTYLTVMYDDNTKQITLLDYPKYNQVADILGEEYATKNGVDWKKVRVQSVDSNGDPVYDTSGNPVYEYIRYPSAAAYYQDAIEQNYYNLYSSDQYDDKRTAFLTAWRSDRTAEELYNDYSLYGPWITPEFCTSFNNGTLTASMDNHTEENQGLASAVFDMLFEPITVHAASGRMEPYFTKHPYDVYENYGRTTAEIYGQYMAPRLDEENLFNAIENIAVPNGVTSIDVNNFIEKNRGNAATYLSVDKIGEDTSEMYRLPDSSKEEENRDEGVTPGLFSGTYDDNANNSDMNMSDTDQLYTKGNDRLKSIDLNGVAYLPDYAFDSCENLEKVIVGATCTRIDKLPFRGCTSLTTVEIAEANPNYVENNRIIYEKDKAEDGTDAGTYTVTECLETRGRYNNSSIVDSGVDPQITNVSAIEPGAFKYCTAVETVNLTDASKLTIVPEECFMNCEVLDEVTLPLAVNKIDKDAFSNANRLRTLKIPGKEVFISTEAFEDNNKDRTDVVTYEDSSARRYADTYAGTYNLRWVDIGDLWNVSFYDMDGTQIGGTITVEDNTRLQQSDIPPNPTREGYTFVKWVGTGGIDVDGYITQDTNFTALYMSTSTMVDGKYVVKFFDGITGDQIGKDQLVEPGSAAVQPQAPDHTSEGYKFLEYHVNEGLDLENVQANIDSIALYGLINPGGNGGGNGTTSGGTTNTSGNTTNTSNRTTSTSGTSTSTSGSSTSTTSTSSEAAGKYTVTVLNGSGSGTYDAGSTVIIAANTPATGKKFLRWTTESQGVTFASVSLTATTFVMPANNVTITAEYTDDAGTPTSGTVATTPTSTSTGGTGTTPAVNNGNTRVDITKPGISNRDLATANVNGSTDNFIVKISETEEATLAVMNALTNKYGNLDNILYYAMDISLYDSTGTTKITDTTGLTVDITIPLPDALLTYGGNNMMGAVVSNQLEDLSERFTTINGVPCISFTATHFSPYTIYVNTQNLSEGLLDITPKTGDPIHPKWFLSLGLACLSIILFMKKDKKVKVKVKA